MADGLQFWELRRALAAAFRSPRRAPLLRAAASQPASRVSLHYTLPARRQPLHKPTAQAFPPSTCRIGRFAAEAWRDLRRSIVTMEVAVLVDQYLGNPAACMGV